MSLFVGRSVREMAVGIVGETREREMEGGERGGGGKRERERGGEIERDGERGG